MDIWYMTEISMRNAWVCQQMIWDNYISIWKKLKLDLWLTSYPKIIQDGLKTKPWTAKQQRFSNRIQNHEPQTMHHSALGNCINLTAVPWGILNFWRNTGLSDTCQTVHEWLARDGFNIRSSYIPCDGIIFLQSWVFSSCCNQRQIPHKNQMWNRKWEW